MTGLALIPSPVPLPASPPLGYLMFCTAPPSCEKDTHGVFSEPVDPEEEQFETIFTQARSEAASYPGGSESTSVDPINEEKLRIKSWIDDADGITNKGTLYGVGKVGSALRLADAFPNLSFGRSTQESEEILQLEQQVRQSREEARQSREEARQSREQNERLQRQFESLFNAVLPLLPSDTQQLLQQQTNIQADNEEGTVVFKGLCTVYTTQRMPEYRTRPLYNDFCKDGSFGVATDILL
ncbi:hypothetical protein Fmac_018176 [Flemingia macrophylla]|uniref:Uncharacterized protein n=1 Tax=Flemingia macrophylla TaxID=520843 RepID=A0ABD1M484_9FABA